MPVLMILHCVRLCGILGGKMRARDVHVMLRVNREKVV